MWPKWMLVTVDTNYHLWTETPPLSNSQVSLNPVCTFNVLHCIWVAELSIRKQEHVLNWKWNNTALMNNIDKDKYSTLEHFFLFWFTLYNVSMDMCHFWTELWISASWETHWKSIFIMQRMESFFHPDTRLESLFTILQLQDSWINRSYTTFWFHSW